MAVRSSPTLGEERLLAAFPFLPGAERLIESMHLTLRELVADPAFARARELGRTRVLAATEDPTAEREIEELGHATPEEQFLSFLYCRVLLGAAPHPAPGRRWAVAEAKRAYGRIRESDPAQFVEVARRLEVTLGGGEREYTVPLPQYIRLATPIREAAFRLPQQRLKSGRVTVRRDRAARLIQEAIRLRLTPPLQLDPELARMLVEREGEFLEELNRRMPSPVLRGPLGGSRLKPEWFPPCIRKMRRMLQEGENLSHSGRFALAAFLHRAGADLETIVDQYRGAPDFDEGITRYQAEHITRHREGVGYEPPECATLRSHGLCFREGDPTAKQPADRERDPRCFEPTLRHPLQYYRNRGGAVFDSEPQVRR